MQSPFAQTFKNKNQLNPEGIKTQDLTDAVNAARLTLVKEDLTELFDKETIACMRATD